MILDQRITNFASETWLKELREMEADDETTAYVVSAATPPLARPPLTLLPTAVDEVDGDDCEASVCFYRRHAIEVRRVHELAEEVTP